MNPLCRFCEKLVCKKPEDFLKNTLCLKEFLNLIRTGKRLTLRVHVGHGLHSTEELWLDNGLIKQHTHSQTEPTIQYSATSFLQSHLFEALRNGQVMLSE